MAINLDKLKPFDSTEYLDSEESIQAYLSVALDSGDAEFIASAIGTIAKAKGMSQLAKETGLSRESLYKSFSRKGNPNLKTLLSVTQALGVSLSAKVSTV
ncbi:addiction module antidote protein [Vibrio cyclitrophicus]|uniref:addiction module antidote protein n=1 Tax=Vibrio splendidus TaxID=29497 RepID=UPI002236594B|nr:addiction module antidote protein [Vibrio splendidus]MCW4446843.1 putative addiction module antidote protein [Vibrio splendidus]MCW4446850.1 putative addiction module antidote protein [Vibrio splendidus]